MKFYISEDRNPVGFIDRTIYLLPLAHIHSWSADIDIWQLQVSSLAMILVRQWESMKCLVHVGWKLLWYPMRCDPWQIYDTYIDIYAVSSTFVSFQFLFFLCIFIFSSFLQFNSKEEIVDAAWHVHLGTTQFGFTERLDSLRRGAISGS